MNQPKVQEDVPSGGASPETNPTGQTPHGIPHGAEDTDPAGRPSSDREQTETAPVRIEKGS